MEKVIYYEPAGRIHSAHRELIKNPPEGYRFITGRGFLDGIVNNNLIFDKIRLQYLDRLMPLNYIKAKFDSLKKLPPEVDMIFAYNHLVFRKIPWIIHCEWAHIPIGRDLRFFPRYKKRVEEVLSLSYCKGIRTLTAMAKESILRNYDTTGFEDKIKVVPIAIKSVDYNRDYNRDNVNLLFVGSVNSPVDFDEKGAGDVIKVFRLLREEYKDLTLTMRARIPKNLHIEDVPGLTLINHILSKQELSQLFKDADIFVFPTHLAQNYVVVEAMSYGLPIVTSWIGSNCGEYIEDGITGFVLPQNNVSYFMDNLILTSETIYRHKLVELAHNDLEPLIETLTRLIESSELRERLGRNAKAEVDIGRFSIGYRNALLKEMFDA